MHATTYDIAGTEVIDPIRVATKLAGAQLQPAGPFARQLAQEPRLREALWFISAMARQPGGLPQFVDWFLNAVPNFGTSAMRQAGNPKGGSYPLEQIVSIWKSDRRIYCDSETVELGNVTSIQGADDQLMDTWLGQMDDAGKSKPLPPESFTEWLEANLFDDATAASFKRDTDPRKREHWLTHRNREWMLSQCRAAAAENLASHLKQWCEDAHSACRSPWYYADLRPALCQAMDRWAEQTLSRIAETEVTRRVFRALNFAWKQNAFAEIEGDTRVGKTNSLQLHCAAYPGRARYLAVPTGNTEQELLVEIARAFGVPVPEDLSRVKLASAVKYLAQYSGLLLVMDEATRLLPNRVARGAAPARIIWVQANLVDPGRPLIISKTPQYTDAVRNFARASKYNLDQWLGRPDIKIKLPSYEAIPDSDLQAIAQHHLPEFDRGLWRKVASRVLTTAGFAKTIEAVSKMAAFIAFENCREGNRTEGDVMQALDEIAPSKLGMLRTENPAPAAESAAPLQARCKAPAAPVQPPESGRRISSRGIAPAPSSEADLDHRRGDLVTA